MERLVRVVFILVLLLVFSLPISTAQVSIKVEDTVGDVVKEDDVKDVLTIDSFVESLQDDTLKQKFTQGILDIISNSLINYLFTLCLC